MPTLRLGELAQAMGGRLARGEANVEVRAFGIDTRTLPRGGVFFALRGTRTDGHRFLEDAARAGAAAVVVSDLPERPDALPLAVILVPDTTDALTRAGLLARSRSRAAFVAVTGSTGKTTTKEMIAAALGARHRVHRTAGNQNNHLGVPLTLLAAPDETEFAVVELGMSAAGEIAALTRMVDPHVGLVTNVAPAHLEFFDSLDDIAAAKGELFAVLRKDSVSVVNLDDPHVRVQAARHAGPRVTFGKAESADFRLVHVEDRLVPGTAFSFTHEGRRHDVQLRFGGAHHAWNALAAVAAAAAAGGEIEPALEALRALEPAEGRGRVHRLPGGLTVVDDSYNSSPAALDAVIRSLGRTPVERRRILVMGDMLELGDEGVNFHRRAGRFAAKAGVHLLVAVGELAAHAQDAARRAGVPETRGVRNADEAAELLPRLVRPGDLVVVKGSRRIRLETVVHALLQHPVEAR